MKRYEAFITKGWREVELANVIVARVDEDGGVTAGFFLVDPLCLGVKDAFFLDDLDEDGLSEIVEERFSEVGVERIHPAWAKKYIEGAAAYAEGIGFSPCRDYRKARRALSGIDAEMCPDEFTYGEDGRPHFVQGAMDDPERTERVLSVLNARLGPDGFAVTLRSDVFADPDISDEAVEETRKAVASILKKIKSTFTVPMLGGIITAMACFPDQFEFDDIIDMLREDKNEDGKPHAEHEIKAIDSMLEIYWVQLCARLEAELEADNSWMFDFYREDFSDERDLSMTLLQWMYGFSGLTKGFPDTWADLRARPELAQHWKTLDGWSDPAALDSFLKSPADETASADAGIPDPFNAHPHEAVLAICRAAREMEE